MSNNVFAGYFVDSYDSFYLEKWADYYDWSGFNAYYCYGPRDYHFYSPATRAEEDSIVIPRDGAHTEGRIIRRGNRFTTVEVQD